MTKILQLTLIHQALKTTPTMTKNVKMPAPALSLVVIVDSDCCAALLGFVVPALGLLADVPPVAFVRGAIEAVMRFVPRTLRADI